MNRKIRRALLSVSDKTGLVPFATTLHAVYGVELVATGGTKTALAAAGLPVKDVAEFTGFPEILGGRVKTLHPGVFAGLLAKRDDAAHMATLAEHQLPEFDLVVCNLYPFEQVAAKPGVTHAEAIENIDIGGPAMLRAAAKNFAAVAVVTAPAQYAVLTGWLAAGGGELTRFQRWTFAAAAFERVADYDQAIATYVNAMEGPALVETFPDTLHVSLNLVQHLRYGENPHQKAAFYAAPGLARPCVATAEQLHGKELSYNNLLDLDAALNMVREFAGPAAVVVKHNNPCGAAAADTPVNAFLAAWSGDPQSAFGGIVAFNRPVDGPTAAAITTGDRFVECVIAPDFDPAALAALCGWKKNVRLLKTGPMSGGPVGLDYRRIDGGLLVQDRDASPDDPATWKIVTKLAPTADQLAALKFAWTIAKHVKSNAIVLAAGGAAESHVVGVGAGQMSRVDAVRIAIHKAGDKARGSVLASDAFFPFADNVELAAAAGVAAIAQPGGSVKDGDSIAACDARGLAMAFTGVRHFRH